MSKLILETRFPEQTRLEAYWQQLRGTRLVPARTEVDPRAIESCLEYAFVLERIAPGLGRFRLAGMHLSDLMGMEVRGMPLTAMFLPDQRQRVSDTLENVFSGPATARLALTGDTGINRPPMEAELSLFPLKSDFGDVSRVLGALTTSGPIGRTPRRFAVASVEVKPLVGDALTSEGQAPSDQPAHPPRRRLDTSIDPQKAPGFAESQRPFHPATAKSGAAAPRPPRTDRPKLRLLTFDN
ncbi:MAG: PAS domain-containing protein [Pseudomonadota bacterium]